MTAAGLGLSLILFAAAGLGMAADEGPRAVRALRRLIVLAHRRRAARHHAGGARHARHHRHRRDGLCEATACTDPGYAFCWDTTHHAYVVTCREHTLTGTQTGRLIPIVAADGRPARGVTR